MTVRFALIGCGRIAKRHVLSLSKLANARLTAVSDIVPERMEDVEKLYNEACGETCKMEKTVQYETLLQDEAIDAVIIASISHTHASIAEKALLRGKHAIVEKPAALSLAEARQLCRLSREKNLKILVCHQMRYRPLFQKLKSVVDEGKLGKIRQSSVSLRLNRNLQYYKQAAWRGSWLQDGGMLLNQGIHMIDLLLWLLGDASRAYGTLSFVHKSKETEDAALAILHFENGATGLIEANTITQPNNFGYSLSLFGDKGTIVIGGHHLAQVQRWYTDDNQSDEESVKELASDTNEHVYMYDHFLHSLDAGSEMMMSDIHEGTRALETIFGIYKSALEGKAVQLPIDNFETAMMADLRSDL